MAGGINSRNLFCLLETAAALLLSSSALLGYFAINDDWSITPHTLMYASGLFCGASLAAIIYVRSSPTMRNDDKAIEFHITALCSWGLMFLFAFGTCISDGNISSGALDLNGGGNYDIVTGSDVTAFMLARTSPSMQSNTTDPLEIYARFLLDNNYGASGAQYFMITSFMIQRAAYYTTRLHWYRTVQAMTVVCALSIARAMMVYASSRKPPVHFKGYLSEGMAAPLKPRRDY